MLKPLTALALILAVAAQPVAAQNVAPASTEHAAKTPSGATFTAPAGWALSTKAKLVELAAPEGDFRMALIDAGAAADAASAIAASWALWAPTNARKSEPGTSRPGRNGWDQRDIVDYPTSPNEKRVIQATASRAGKTWTVVLVDGSKSTAEKRSAAVNLVQQSLRPAGYSRETFAGRTAHAMDPSRIEQLKAFMAQAMKDLDIPGASFALTTREKTIYSTGMGVRLLGDSTPVDADSEFMIASNTKGLATLMLAKLVDEGKLGWDEPVTQAYPTFRLGSDATTKKVLIRHLVCACTGLPRKDMQVRFNSDPNTAATDTFVQLAATEPTSGFGEVYQYNNLMAAAAGFVGAHLVHPDMSLDKAFYSAMSEKVFSPLGMTATTFDFDRAMASNWARPHSDGLTGTVEIIDNGTKLNTAFARYGAAGGAWSTANDLIKYVRFELNDGKLDDGRQYISAKNLLQRRVPNVPVGEDRTYGMGLQTESDFGVDVIHHGGALFGYRSDMMFIPSAGIGAVLLTNSNSGQALLRPFMRRLLELLYDGAPEAAGDVSAAAVQMKTQFSKERDSISQVPDAAAVAALGQEYADKDLGTLKVTRTAKGVNFAFRTFSTDMGTRKNADGTMSFVALDPTAYFLPMVVGTEGGKPALILRDSQHEFKFIATR